MNRISNTQLIDKNILEECAKLLIKNNRWDYAVTHYDEEGVIYDKVIVFSFGTQVNEFHKKQSYCVIKNESYCVITALDTKCVSGDLKYIYSQFNEIKTAVCCNPITISGNTINGMRETRAVKSLLAKTRKYALTMINQYGDKKFDEKELTFENVFITSMEEVIDWVQNNK